MAKTEISLPEAIPLAANISGEKLSNNFIVDFRTKINSSSKSRISPELVATLAT